LGGSQTRDSFGGGVEIVDTLVFISGEKAVGQVIQNLQQVFFSAGQRFEFLVGEVDEFSGQEVVPPTWIRFSP
jgi:hypothetical protein